MPGPFYILPEHKHCANVRENAARAVAGLDLAGRWKVSITEAPRTLDQNSKLHAVLGDIVKSGMKFAGKTRDIEEWKAIFVSGFMAYKRHNSEVIPGIENEFVSLRWSTAKMPKSLASELIEYILAWCAENEVRLSA